MEILKLQKYFNNNVFFIQIVSTGVPYHLSNFYGRIQIVTVFPEFVLYL